jgi:hypothetical protein
MIHMYLQIWTLISHRFQIQLSSYHVPYRHIHGSHAPIDSDIVQFPINIYKVIYIYIYISLNRNMQDTKKDEIRQYCLYCNTPLHKQHIYKI